MVYAGRHARQKSARNTGDLISSIYLRSPIRWQSPIYIESAQRPRPRSEHEKSRAHPGGGARPARDGSSLEDTIMLVAVTNPPSGSQPSREPPSREPTSREITAHSLEEEDSLDADDHQERMRRLSGSIYLDFPPYRPENP